MNILFNKILTLAIVITMMLAIGTNYNANSQKYTMKEYCEKFQNPKRCCEHPDGSGRMFVVREGSLAVESWYPDDTCTACEDDKTIELCCSDSIITHYHYFINAYGVSDSVPWPFCDSIPPYDTLKICCGPDGQPDTVRWLKSKYDPRTDCIEYEEYEYTCCQGIDSVKTFIWNHCWGEQPPCPPTERSKICCNEDVIGKTDTVPWNPCDGDTEPPCIEYKEYTDTCCVDGEMYIYSWNTCENNQKTDCIKYVKSECDSTGDTHTPVPCDTNICDSASIKVNFRIINPFSSKNYAGNPNNPENTTGKNFVELFVELVASMGGKTCCEGIIHWGQIPCDKDGDVPGADAYVDACVPNVDSANAILLAWVNIIKPDTLFEHTDIENANGDIVGGQAGSNGSNYYHPNAFGINSWVKLTDQFEPLNLHNPNTHDQHGDGSPVIKCHCYGK